MKILICSDLAPPYVGGNESYLINLGSGLVRLGHEVHWVTSKLPNTKFSEVIDGIRVYRIPILFARSFRFPGRQSFPLTGLLPAKKLASNMDVLQFNTFVAGTFGWLVGKLSKKPHLLWCHEMFGKLWHKIGQNRVERKIYPYVEKFIAISPYDWFACPSRYSKRTLIEAGADEARISIIPHGIDFQLFNPNVDGMRSRSRFGLEGNRLFGFTGRLGVRGVGQSKNLIMLIEAVKYVVEEIHDAKLILGGSGFHELLPFIKRFGVEKHVVYAGKKGFDEVPNFIAMCDVIACPAIADGYCFLLAEASACGKPLVATNAGAHPERIIHGVTGFLTDLTPEGMAEAIIKVLTDNKLAKKLGEKGAEFSKKFDREKSLTMHLEVYKKIMD